MTEMQLPHDGNYDWTDDELAAAVVTFPPTWVRY